ncbi:SusC/RagA family TonB-linked outer membrane protein [Chryseolinea soli]|uniref:SusC/RagA family TonB-linked outer membrane protein n=1 Tax=Chryseolinea soli TaxID=2321403 RepID=A0A385SJU4_9BACT|nr:SusC/RagA family TonB-linked outer membrane protein [Chryseolinea soli]AYB32023.1 SusC/RagA family TonB-linked outer membrane protein [Chryseolinea soli]
MKIFCTEKLFWLMRMCMFQWLIILTFSGVSMAIDNHAQILETKITLNVENINIVEALDEISAMTGLKFAYSSNVIIPIEKVSINVQDQPLRTIFNDLFGTRRIDYKIREQDNMVFLKKQSPVKKGPLTAPLTMTSAETIIITGQVTDFNNVPMAGVNIVIKGTTNGTTTDKDGNFSIEAENDHVLVFSFIGYSTQEIQVANHTTINVILQEDIKSLGEVVINAGYWEVKNTERTGNISRVTSEEISRQPISNPLQALQGRMPGVVIQQQSGMPGGGFVVRIRGQNSLRADGNEPLYIVDGVPYNGVSFAGAASSEVIPNGNPFTALNPDDIENIEVLKDADATAIYGARGSNGVILITTKKAKDGKPKVDVGIYSGFSKVGHFLDLLSTPQYLEMRKEALRNDKTEPGFLDPDLKLWDSTRYTDWQRELIGGTAYATNAKVSISGGTKDTQFLIGGGYFRQSTVFPGNFNDQKISGHVNLNHNPTNGKFSFNFSGSYLFDNNNLLRNDITRYITLPPNTPVPFNEDGSLNWENSSWENPYAFLQKPYEGKTNNLISSLSLKYQIIPGLFVKSNLGFTDTQVKEFSAFPIGTTNPAYGINTAISVFSTGSIRTWNVEPQIEYSRPFAKAVLNVLIGTTFLQNRQLGNDVEAYGYTSNAVLKDLMSAASLSVVETRDITYRYNAIFGRINLNWDKKYLLNLTARRDGSSRFGPESRFANFGAIGVGWIFSNENFLLENSVITFGKLRASYGITGSDQIGDYQYLDTYQATYNTYQGKTGIVPARLANAIYSWENNKKLEVALDLGLCNNRLQVSTSYFNNRSSNQLVGLALPSITGFNSIQSNFPATVQNSGLEIELQSINVKHLDFLWTASANLTFPRNKLLEYPNLQGSSYANTYEVGKSLYIKKRYHFTGIDTQTGLITFEDKNSNGVGTNYPADLQAIKQITQDYYGGIQNTLSYKGFQLSIFLQFVKQTGYSYMASPAFVVPGRKGNQMTDVLSRWQKPGDVSEFQMFTSSYSSKGSSLYSTSTYAGDNSITDASFIRLQNLYFAWEFPQTMARRLHMKGGKLYTQGQNIFTWTKYKGLSPETQSQTMLPPLRTITIGFQISI